MNTTVKYVAKDSSKVRVGGKEYSGNMVIPVGGDKGLSDDDIKRLLRDNFIRKYELEEGEQKEAPPKSAPPAEKKLEQMNKAELLAKAKELGIEADGNATVADLRQKIAEGKKEENPLDIMTREEMLAEAAALGIADKITETATAEEIQKLIAEAKAQ